MLALVVGTCDAGARAIALAAALSGGAGARVRETSEGANAMSPAGACGPATTTSPRWRRWGHCVRCPPATHSQHLAKSAKSRPRISAYCEGLITEQEMHCMLTFTSVMLTALDALQYVVILAQTRLGRTPNRSQIRPLSR